MKKIENGYCDYYYLTEKGEVYNKKQDKFIKPTKEHLFKLKRQDGSFKMISLKTIYKIVYGKNFCIDKIENIKNEQWIAIDRTDEIYWISNYGRVKSYAGYNAIILKSSITKQGYKRLDIVQEGIRVSKFVHCLVAAAFLPKPESIEMQIHHIDFNKLNNLANNLQYCTPQQHLKIHAERRNKEKYGSICDQSEPKDY